MNLTEPQAGSDLGAIRTRAERDGHRYRIAGQKIYITYGDHDLANNVIHLVLARTPDAPSGSKGISLFVVPKFLVNADGSLGPRNDLRCVSLEHKLGIRASPTVVMAYGDDDGAIGFLVGEENRGLECMFTMMNNARLAVGLEGVAIAERAYQQAASFARERRQGRAIVEGRDEEPAAIVRHPDVRRMLMTMRANTQAARALAYTTAAALDVAARHPDPAKAERARLRVDLLTPVVKAWSTDLGCEVASLGIQVHGGMGFIEETGAAQHLRDARIAPIYEGTNGIQANDLVFRKLARDRGAAADRFIAECRAVAAALGNEPSDALTAIGSALHAGADALATATACMVERTAADRPAAAAAASPYLRLFGLVAGGAMMAQAARAASAPTSAERADAPFRAAKLVTARFYAEQILPAVHGLLPIIMAGQAATLALADDTF
jgi:alkylation response protein AidB-like acyl-CoA dehydrogenase